MKRSMPRRLLIGGLAAAALLATAPAAAYAGPAPALGGAYAARAADPNLYEEKLAVAVKFGLGDNAGLPERKHCDFVIAIWNHVKADDDHLEVRLAAEQAYSAPELADEACARFILTEVYAAFDRDVAREKREADEKRESDVARTTAAASIDVVADAALLAGTDEDFIRRIRELVDENPKWPKVKAAATIARDGTAEQQRQFIASGMAAAARQDVDDRIAADEAKTAAEKARELNRSAKRSAANRIAMPVTEELLDLPDRDFVVSVWNFSQDGTEVYDAAMRAARSMTAADWKAFIEDGIHQAKDRDIKIALDKKAAEDRRLAEEVRAKALADGFDNLVTAVTQALAAGPDAVADFLRVEQYQIATDEANRPSGGSWEWRNVHSNKCLTPDGARLVQRDCGTDDQLWIAIRVYDTGGRYRIVNAKDRTKCVGITGGAKESDVPMDLRTCDGGADQYYYYNKVGENYIWINENANKAITVQGASRDNGAVAITYDVNQGNNQQWYPTSLRLSAGQRLIEARGLHSRNNHALWLQRDGNLVVYKTGKAVWATNTTNGETLLNQRDGNLVLYRANKTVAWSSGTYGNGPSTLWMQEDGNLVLYRNSDGKATWSSRTAG